MKYFLVFIFLFALSCSTTQTHYKDYHGKTHYRSAGTRAFNSNTGTFQHKLIPKHNSANVQPMAKLKSQSSTNKATGSNTKGAGVNDKQTQTTKSTEENSSIIPVIKVDPLPAETTATTGLLTEAAYAKLKALIIVGDVDGPKGQTSQEYIARGKRIEEFFKRRKIQVSSFYCPADKWEDITKASAGANFLVYLGHGTTAGTNGKWGGFCLTDGIISSLTINQQLKLAPNSIILFNSVCGGAGSSAGDTHDIGIPEAEDRVTAYAHPFVDLNAAIYFANNYFYSAEQFLTDLFTKPEAIEAIYKSEVESYRNIPQLAATYPYNEKYAVGISSYPTNSEITFYQSTNGGPPVPHKVFMKNSYEIAMVYKKGFKIQDIVK